MTQQLSNDFDFGQIMENLNNKVDLDCANISETGRKVFDGQWVNVTVLLSSVKAAGIYNIDLSSYLPDDGSIYEVLLVSTAQCTQNNGAPEVWTAVKSSVIQTYIYIVNCYFQGYMPDKGNAILPVGTDRILSFIVNGTSLTGAGLVLCGYRRLGRNE